MLVSMNSGIAGLNAHQERMDVVANDVANVNTVGYKQSAITFKEALVSTVTPPATGTPGKQVGQGVAVSGITRDFSQGAITESGVSSHLAIQGEGFFVVQDTDPATYAVTGQQYYTRAGDFVLDAKDDTTVYLITSEGKALLDTSGVPINLVTGMPAGVELSSYAISQDGSVTSTGSDGNTYAVGTVAAVSFQNNNGLAAVGSNLYEWTEAASTTQPLLDGSANDSATYILQGYLEYSNVDLAKEFTEMIITQRGFQANSRSITTSDDMLNELLSLTR